jgi:hypothetical protein
MARDLGEVTDPVEEVEEITFPYFGQTIRVNPVYSELDLLDFVEAGTSLDEKDPKAVMLIKTFFRTVVHPEDFEQFWAAAKANRQGVEKLAATYGRIVAGLTDRPTQPPSGSSDGRPPTATTSTDGDWTGAFSPEGRRALSILNGRADLQRHVVLREDALASSRCTYATAHRAGDVQRADRGAGPDAGAGRLRRGADGHAGTGRPANVGPTQGVGRLM